MAASICENEQLNTMTNTEDPRNESSPKQITTSKDLLNVGESKDTSLLIAKGGKPKATGPPKTFKPPPSSVLQNVRNFLPQMAAAQKELDKRLQQEPKENLDIENVGECDKVIEMTLALVEQQSSDSDSEDEDDSSESDVETSTSNKPDCGLLGPITEDNLRLPGPKTAPMIEMIQTEQSSTSIDTMDCSEPTPP